MMHLGYNNSKYTYYMPGSDGTLVELSETTADEDIGVIVDNKIYFHEHVATATKKDNSILGTIKKTFSYLDSVMIKKLFVSLVRPVLEYGNYVRSPLFKKNTIKIEQVQRRAIQLIPENRINITWIGSKSRGYLHCTIGRKEVICYTLSKSLNIR